MLRNAVLISLSGLHGSGKTSLSEYIRREFQRRGVECKTVYLGGWHTFEYVKLPLSKALALVGLEEQDERVRLLLSKVLPLIFLIQYTLYFFYKTRSILFSRRKTLCIVDRYIVDCLVELSILTNDGNFSETIIGNHLLSFPRPELSFHLDTEESLVVQRKKDERHELSELARRRQLYKLFARQFNIYTINTTTMSLLRIKNQLVRMIEEALENGAN
ncbi:MAG: hypothetical protein PVF15_00875 [Candidatus Bathyarchaeota archaeon]|jgi:thymidylate kinase